MKLKMKDVAKRGRSRTTDYAMSGGQTFEPFLMLIFIIVSLLVLFFILSAVSYFEQQKMEVSNRRLLDGVQSASKGLDSITPEHPLLVDNLFLNAANYTALVFSKDTGIPKECIFLQGDPRKKSIFTSSDHSLVRLDEKLNLDVYAYCTTQKIECPIYCSVFFGITPSQAAALGVSIGS